MEEDIKCIKLLNGDEIIANVRTDEQTGALSVNFPQLIVPTGEIGKMTLVPWFFTIECVEENNWCVINPVNVVSVGTPYGTLVDAYRKCKLKTFNKLDVVDKPNIILG